MLFNSIRLKLTLWFAATLTLVMVASAIFADRYISEVMQQHTDERLKLIADEIVTFHQKNHQLLTNDNELCDTAKSLVRNFSWGISFQLTDPQGELTCDTQVLGGGKLPLPSEAQRAELRKDPRYVTLPQSDRTSRIRVYGVAIAQNGSIIDYLQIGHDLHDQEATLADLRSTLMILTPLLIILVGVSSYYISGWALSSISVITAEIKEITAERLNTRLTAEDHPSELQQLTLTFNSMLERLNESFSRIRQFTGDASHELRTPLAILKGETEVALRWAKGEEELRAALVSNLEEIERMEMITEGLLFLAKEEAQELRLTPINFSLTDMLQDLYLIGKALAEQKQITIDLRLNTDHEVFIHADQMQIHRALLNLVSNGVKYTPPEGSVTLTLNLLAEETIAYIRIDDTGIGIAAEHLPHIFERFYRTDDARNRDIGGTGLGLSIVRAIVTAHGGRVDVTSSFGEGSSFSVQLPLNQSAKGRNFPIPPIDIAP